MLFKEQFFGFSCLFKLSFFPLAVLCLELLGCLTLFHFFLLLLFLHLALLLVSEDVLKRRFVTLESDKDLAFITSDLGALQRKQLVDDFIFSQKQHVLTVHEEYLVFGQAKVRRNLSFDIVEGIRSVIQVEERTFIRVVHHVLHVGIRKRLNVRIHYVLADLVDLLIHDYLNIFLRLSPQLLLPRLVSLGLARVVAVSIAVDHDVSAKLILLLILYLIEQIVHLDQSLFLLLELLVDLLMFFSQLLIMLVTLFGLLVPITELLLQTLNVFLLLILLGHVPLSRHLSVVN